MNGEDGGGAAERGVAQEGVEEDRDEAGGPVVAVDDIGNPAELEAEGEGGAAEEDEAQVVVAVGAPGAAVDLGATEEAIVFDEVGGDAAAGQGGLPGAGPVAVVADIDAERGGERSPFAADPDGTVGGADDADIVAEGGELTGKGADHVGEAADLHEGLHFGCDEENLERLHEGSGRPKGGRVPSAKNGRAGTSATVGWIRRAGRKAGSLRSEAGRNADGRRRTAGDQVAALGRGTPSSTEWGW